MTKGKIPVILQVEGGVAEIWENDEIDVVKIDFDELEDKSDAERLHWYLDRWHEAVEVCAPEGVFYMLAQPMIRHLTEMFDEHLPDEVLDSVIAASADRLPDRH